MNVNAKFLREISLFAPRRCVCPDHRRRPWRCLEGLHITFSEHEVGRLVDVGSEVPGTRCYRRRARGAEERGVELWVGIKEVIVEEDGEAEIYGAVGEVIDVFVGGEWVRCFGRGCGGAFGGALMVTTLELEFNGGFQPREESALLAWLTGVYSERPPRHHEFDGCACGMRRKLVQGR